MPELSVILPSYNHKKFLKQRLDTIINQTYTKWQIIIIDDNSTDGSIEILKDFVKKNKNKIEHFIINETNSGSGYHSWKKGIELADTEYIWIAETDDYSDLNFLKKSVSTLEKNKDCSLVFCATNYVDSDNKKLYDSSKRTSILSVEERRYAFFDYQTLLDNMPFNTLITNGSSVVFRKPKSIVPYEIFQHKQSSDLFLWTYIVKNHDFAFLNKPLNHFRRHNESTTTKYFQQHSNILYFERANYLNYFNIQSKHKQFIHHYIKNYIDQNKSHVFNIAPILKIKNVSGLRIKYIKLLIAFYFKKIISKILV